MVRGETRILIFCPAIGRVSWKTELPKWQNTRQIMQITSQTTSIPSGPVAAVVSYDLLSRAQGFRKVQKLLRSTEKFDVVVLDEAHYLKSPDANRTKALYGSRLDLANGLIKEALAQGGAIWPASATPTKANAADLYPHLKALFPDALRALFGGEVPTRNQFVERFCTFFDGLYGREITGNNPKTISDLVAAIRPHFIVRRKSDVAQELGSVLHITLPLEVKEHNENIDNADTVPNDRTKFLDLLENAPADANIPDPPPHLMQQWRELGEAKVEPATAWIRDFLDQHPNKKLVVFAHHRSVIQHLAQAFPGESVTLFGGTSPLAREQAVADFQGKPSVRIFIGQTMAAGTSITLTAASDVLVLEPEWAALDMYQAISRCHRLGQTEPVTAYYAYADDTVDARIARAVRRRTEDFEKLIGGLAA